MDRLKTRVSQLVAGKTRTTLALQQSAITAVFRGVNILISIMYVPLLLNYLEPERYGVWLTLISIVTWMGIFDVGLGNGLRNKLTEALAKEDFQLARIYISTTYALLTIIFIPLALIFYLLSHFINWSRILNTSAIATSELLAIVNIVFLVFCLKFILQIIGVVFKAHQKPSVENLMIAISSLLSFCAVYAMTVIYDSHSMIILSIIITGIPVVVYFILSVYAFSTRLKFISPEIKHVNFSYTGELLNLGFKFFIIQITYILIFTSSNIIIIHLFGADEVVRYNIAYKLFSLPIMIYTIVLSPIWSAVTDAYVRNDFNWIKITVKRLNLFSLIMLVFIGLLVVSSSYIYYFWVGNKVDIPFSLTAAMAVFSSIFVISAPYSALVNGFGKLKLTASMSIVNVAVYFLSVFFLYKYIDGSQCIAISLSVTGAIGFVVRFLQTQKIISGNARGIWVR